MNDFYTYLYIDPVRNEPIYVGKGKGARAFIHLRRKDNHPFTRMLQSMARQDVKPVISFLKATAEKNTCRRRPIVTCPHCHKTGGSGVMTRWHFDNCKAKNG